MNPELSHHQKEKINAAKRMVEFLDESNLLYNLIVVVGPSTFGAIFESNSDTAWSRIENPLLFRLGELLLLANAFDCSLDQFLAIVFNQIDYNNIETMKGNLIGRFKYQENKH